MAKKTNIVLTGGHAGSTGYAIAEEVLRQKKRWSLYWVGTKKAKEGSSSESFEATELPKLGVKFINLPAGRLQRKFSRHSIVSLLRIPLGFLFSLYWLVKIHPKAVLSFGGFAALPVVVAAWLMRIPVMLQEQTSVVGLSNKLMAPFAIKIAIARQSSSQYLPAKKLVLTGNPTRQKILRIRKTKKDAFKKPVLLITGGSRGSLRINKVIKKGINNFTSKFHVIHQVGSDYVEEFEKLKSSLPKKLNSNYEVYGFAEPNEIAKLFSRADIVISRAGANTVWELMSMGMPSVLIPIPWTRYDEQTKNAELARKEGIAKILKEDELSVDTLLHTVQLIKSNYSKILQNYENRRLDEKASKNVVGLLNDTISA